MPNFGELWALFFNDVDQLNKVFTPKVIEQSTSSDELFIDQNTNSAFYSFYFLTYGTGKLRIGTIVGYDKESNKAAILTMFPFQTSGKEYMLTISSIDPTLERTEAFITGTLVKGHTVVGFEPTFLAVHKKLRVGDTIPFLFSAFGYTLFKAESYFLSMESSELESTLKRLNIEKSILTTVLETEPDGLNFDLSQLNAFVPMVAGTNDYYFLGKIKSLTSLSFEHILLYDLELVIKLEHSEIEIPVIIPFDRIERGFKPAVGDTIIGSLWLQTLSKMDGHSKD